MADVSSTLYSLVPNGTLKVASLPIAASHTAYAGTTCCIDTANPGAVYPATTGSTTLVPIGKFNDTVTAGAGGTAQVGVTLDREHYITYYDSVTGGGAVTALNLFQTVNLASNHEVTTTASGSPTLSVVGRVWVILPNGTVGVETPW